MRWSNRPILNLPGTNAERALEAVGLLLLLGWLAYTASVWSTLPERVPTHFGVSGAVDAWGGRLSVLILPLVGSSLYLVLSVLQRFPRFYNYPVRVTAQNAATLYRLGRQLLLWVKVLTTCTLAFLFGTIVSVARGETPGLTPLFVPLLLLPLIGVTSVLVLRMRRAK